MKVQFNSIEVGLLKIAFQEMKKLNKEIYSFDLKSDNLYINDGDYIVEFMDIKAKNFEDNYSFYPTEV